MLTKEDKQVILLVSFFICLIPLLILVDSYKDYHAKMHGVPTWGRIIAVDKCAVARGPSNRCEYEYSVNGAMYTKYALNLPKRFIGDSIIVIYDTTNAKRAFPLCNDPSDMKTAFFKSKKDYMPLKWQQNYDQCLSILERKRKAHRAREHIYDYFCKDD